MKLADLSPQAQAQPSPEARSQDPRGAWLRELERAHLLDWFGSRVAHAATPLQWQPHLRAAPEAGTQQEQSDANMQARQWPARSVHMSMESSGAQVWIRDAGLTKGAAAGILSSLAGELAQRGLRLRALTVNGRTAFEWEPATGSESGSSRSTFSEKVNRHGDH